MARPRSDIRLRIVRAARRRFLVEGVDGASMRAIAKDARTSLGMITYYFASKDELFLAVLEDRYEKLLADLELCLGGDAPVRDRLRAAIVRIGTASKEELEVLRLVLREALISSARLDGIVRRFQRGHLPMVLATIAQAQEDGLVRRDLPLPIAMISIFAVGVIPQLALPRLAHRVMGPVVAQSEQLQGDVLVDLLLDTVFRGIAPR